MPTPTTSIVGIDKPVLTSKSKRTDIYGIEYGNFTIVGRTTNIESINNNINIGETPNLDEIVITGFVSNSEIKTLQGGISQIDISTAYVKKPTSILKEYILTSKNSFCIVPKKVEVTYSSSSANSTAGLMAPTTIGSIFVPGPDQGTIKNFNDEDKNKADTKERSRYSPVPGGNPIIYFFKYRIYEGHKLISHSTSAIVPNRAYINTALYGDVWTTETEYKVLIPPAVSPL